MAAVAIVDGNLVTRGTEILSGVHDNVVLTPAAPMETAEGAFIGVRTERRGCRNVFPIGKLRNLKFMCTFRYRLWWMTQRMGTCGRDIPTETQFLIVEGINCFEEKEGNADGVEQSALYTVFLPLLEGDFRTSLQGNENDELEICLESAVEAFRGTHLVFVSAGSDPFEVTSNAVKTVERHLQTFFHREKKKIPDLINWFGWCTWDAFYTNISAEGIWQGLQSFNEGGIPPRFVIIDDGWLLVDMDRTGVASIADNAANFANRLTDIKENHKFQKNENKGHCDEDSANGLAQFVKDIKEKYNVK